MSQSANTVSCPNIRSWNDVKKFKKLTRNSGTVSLHKGYLKYKNNCLNYWTREEQHKPKQMEVN